VVNVSQIGTVDRQRLFDKVGALGPSRLRKVLNGLGLVLGLTGVEGDPGSPQ
jgi:mRNA-degrading endonuclease toxin of MazEF toxin-antitoxin module